MDRRARLLEVGVFSGFALLSAGISIVISTALGMSLWWDTLNYEYFSGWAVFHGFGSPFAFPGQMQTYLSPIPNTFYYLALAHLGPRTGSQLIAFSESLGPAVLAYGVWRVARLRQRSVLSSLGLGSVAGGMALGCALYVTELGTTASDSLIALPIFLGAGLISWAQLTTRPRRNLTLLGLAGVTLGFATAAKFTAAMFVVALVLGFGVAVLAGTEPSISLRRKIGSWCLLAGTTFATALICYAPTGVMVAKRYQNPFYPYFNRLAGSPDQLAENIQDRRFAVHGVGDWLSNIKGLLVGSRLLESGNLLQRSPLLVLGVIALVVVLTLELFGRRRPNIVFLATSSILGFFIWTSTLVIYRYGTALEMAIATVLILIAIEASPSRSIAPWIVSAACVLALLVGGAGAPVKRVAFTPKLLSDADTAALNAKNTGHLVVTGSSFPAGALLTTFPASTDIVRLGGNLDGVMSKQWWAKASTHVVQTPGPWAVLFPEGQDAIISPSLLRYGLQARISGCITTSGGGKLRVTMCTLDVDGVTEPLQVKEPKLLTAP